MKRFIGLLILLVSVAGSGWAQTGCVELKEIDGTPDVKCVKTIKVTNGTLACSGNVCTITISGGGGGSPGGADTNVQYNDSGSFGGVAGFIFDKTSKITLGVAGTSVGGVAFKNATSGTITVQPVTGALGTVTLSLPATTGTLALTSQLTAGTVTSVGFTGGIVSVATATTTPAFTIAGTSGGVPYFASGSTWASSAALAANALVIGGGAGVAPATTTTGTGVLTALGVNVGSAGAFVTFNGALGTPSSGTLTNATGLPPTTGIVGWPANASGVLTNNGSGTLTWGAGGSGLTVGTTTVTSGTGGRLFYETTGNVLGEISTLTSDGTIVTFAPTVTTGTGTTSGLNANANSLTTGDAFNFGSSSVSSGNVMKISATGTAAASNTKTALNVATSGANATSAMTTYGGRFNNTSTGTTSVNVGVQAAASGGATNYDLQIGDGTAASARLETSLSGANDPTILFGNATIDLAPAGGTGYNQRFSNTAVILASGIQLGWGATSSSASSSDLILRRAAAANLAFGAADAASPVAQTISVQNVVAGTSNTAGANFTIAGSRGSGTGVGGSLIFQVAPAGSTGTSQNALATALTIDSTKASTFAGAISGTTANFSGAITVASCTGCGGTTINASGQGIWIPDIFYDADSFEGVASGNDVKFYRFINPVAVTADRADFRALVASASGKFSFALRSWDCTTTTYFDSGVLDTTSWGGADITATLSSATLPAGGVCLLWTYDNSTAKTRVVGPQANTMAVWNIPASGTKRLGTCSNTSSAGVLPGSCGTETGSNPQGVFQFTLRKN